jgi:tRNA(adenine34) deaminase
MGACGTLYTIPQDSRLNHNIEVIGGILQDECGTILSTFFDKLRNNLKA